MWSLWGTFSVNHEGHRIDISEALCIAYCILYTFIQQIYCIFLLENHVFAFF